MIPNKKLMCMLLVFNHRRPLYRTGNEIATVTLSDLAALGHLSHRERQGVAVLPKVYRSAPFISACLENGNTAILHSTSFFANAIPCSAR